MTGQMVGKYKVEDRVGRGGMGTVYRAMDETLQREVALKVLNAELNDPEVARRFRAEAVTVARLSHPGIATIYELFQNDGQWLMVMEFVRGETLERLVTRAGALPVPRVSELCMQALAALAHAHALGVVHRDLKPANLMINETGVVKVMDFGIARVSGSEHLTNAGFMMGTPAYMAPEQVMGAEVDLRADLYAMGVVFYRLVTGKLPFKGDTAFAMAQSQVNDPPTPVMMARPDLPPWVEPIITRALAKDPQDRFQSAAEFHEALARSVAGMPLPEYDDGSAPTELMATPTRTPLGMPTPYAGATTVSATPAGYAPSTRPPAPVATGGTKQATAGTKQPTVGTKQPTVGMKQPTVGMKLQTAAARITAKVAAITKNNKKMTTPMIAGAAALVVIIGLGIWMATRSSAPVPAPAPPPPAPAVADVTPPPATPPDTNATTPPPTDPNAAAPPPTSEATAAIPAGAGGAPAQPQTTPQTPPQTPPQAQAQAPNPATQKPPAGRSASTTAGKGDKAGAPAGSRGTASGAPNTPPPQQQQQQQPQPPPPVTPAKPTTETAPPTAPPAVAAPAPTDPLAAFGSTKLLEVNGRRSTDRDVVINFGGGHILVLPKDGGAAITTLQYKQIRKATYSVGRDPKWDSSLASPPADLDVGSILRQSRHWLVLQTADAFTILRLDERNAVKFVQTLEERTGLKADRPVQGK